MLSSQQLTAMKVNGRTISKASIKDDELGPLKLLAGKWRNVNGLEGHGWNMIALPFVAPAPAKTDFRLLLNQYNEELDFTLVDKGVPNRGLTKTATGLINSDQFLAALRYQQSITQIAADDFPVSGLAGKPGAAIHFEPGLWLHMANQVSTGHDIARLSSVPHGDSVLALGQHTEVAGAPVIREINSLPIGVPQSLTDPYLAPYSHFHAQPFRGLFDPTLPNALLNTANQGVNIKKATILSVDTTIETGGIHNIPFVVKQANAVTMKSTFWIQEILDANNKPQMRLQYSQLVLLEFFPRPDGKGLIQWPHISINTLEKIPDAP